MSTSCQPSQGVPSPPTGTTGGFYRFSRVFKDEKYSIPPCPLQREASSEREVFAEAVELQILETWEEYSKEKARFSGVAVFSSLQKFIILTFTMITRQQKVADKRWQSKACQWVILLSLLLTLPLLLLMVS